MYSREVSIDRNFDIDITFLDRLNRYSLRKILTKLSYNKIVR
jgi:hypothetical protein